MNNIESITIRSIVPEDRNFIFASFLRGLFYGESWFTIIEKRHFMTHYHKVIEYILDKPTTEVKIACKKDNLNTIVGYCLYEGSKVHWVFVKKDWRKLGIAKNLVPNEINTVTHLTKVGLSIINNKKIEFKPFEV